MPGTDLHAELLSRYCSAKLFNLSKGLQTRREILAKESTLSWGPNGVDLLLFQANPEEYDIRDFILRGLRQRK